ncbi:hypothetical protein BDF19DRAFT_426379 [Syncephalis fuscata]|nr:hypothetical protein BDF19DRAFT_426379 [Syncephalis fuscata]
MSIPMVPLSSGAPSNKSAKGKEIVDEYLAINKTEPLESDTKHLPWDEVSLAEDHGSKLSSKDNEHAATSENYTYTAPLYPDKVHEEKDTHPFTMPVVASKEQGVHIKEKGHVAPPMVVLENTPNNLEQARGFDPDENPGARGSAPGCCGLPVTFWLFIFGFCFPILWFIGSYWLTSRHSRVRFWAWINFCFALSSLIVSIVVGIRYGS